jgi:hypothetical protein
MSGDYWEVSGAVRRDIKDDPGEELPDCDRIRADAVGRFENWIGRGIESTADGMVVALLARSTDTFTCPLGSVRLGCSRTCWMRTGSPLIQRRPRRDILDHHDHARMLLADAVATFPGMRAITICSLVVKPGRNAPLPRRLRRGPLLALVRRSRGRRPRRSRSSASVLRPPGVGRFSPSAWRVRGRGR